MSTLKDIVDTVASTAAVTSTQEPRSTSQWTVVQTQEANVAIVSAGTEQASATSRSAQHSTLFCAFNLNATAFYNRFVADEEVAYPDPNLPLDEIPRFIRLRWRVAPDLSATKEKPVYGLSSGGSVGGVKFPEQRESIKTVRGATANPHAPGGEFGIKAAVQVPVKSVKSKDSLTTTLDGSRGPSVIDVAYTSRTTTNQAAAVNKSYLANFVDAGMLEGALAKGRSDSLSQSHHIDSVVQIGTLAEGIDATSVKQPPSLSVDIPSFPAIGNEPSVSYVGYHIERYRLADGVYSLDREFDVSDPTSTEFIDTEVLYSSSYRYRIRTFARVVTKSDRALTFAPATARYYSSEWSREWAYATVEDVLPPAPPDELTVRPDSFRRCIHISWRVPSDPQGDLLSFKLFRKLDLGKAGFGPWVELGTFLSQNGLYIDEQVGYYQDTGQRYVYAMQTVSRHGELSPLSEQLSVSLTKTYEVAGEDEVQFVSSAGVTLEDSPAHHLPLRNEVIVLSGADFVVAGRSGRASSLSSDRSYRLRLKSLTTGQNFDVAVDLAFRTLVSTPSSVKPPSTAAQSKPTQPQLPTGRPVSRRPSNAKVLR